jgi:membrane protease YdiL (CAAX protease family)
LAVAGRRVDWTGAIVFVLLAYGLSWGWLFLVPHIGIPLWTIGFASFGPAAAAFLVRGPLLGEGFRQSGLGFTTPRGRAWTYVFALVGPPLIAIVTAGALVVFGGARLAAGEAHDPLQGQDYFFTLAASKGPSGLLTIFALSPLLSVVAFGEEFGWRGYLFPKLMPLGAPIAMFGSGAIWALWHLPGYLIYGTGGPVGFVVFALLTTAASPLFCWLRLRARSVWPAAMWHSAYDNQAPAVAGLLTPGNWPADQLTMGVLFAVQAFELLATAFLFAFGGILRAEREDRAVWNAYRAET